jgi:hypothetical protein
LGRRARRRNSSWRIRPQYRMAAVYLKQSMASGAKAPIIASHHGGAEAPPFRSVAVKLARLVV